MWVYLELNKIIIYYSISTFIYRWFSKYVNKNLKFETSWHMLTDFLGTSQSPFEIPFLRALPLVLLTLVVVEQYHSFIFLVCEKILNFFWWICHNWWKLAVMSTYLIKMKKPRQSFAKEKLGLNGLLWETSNLR